MALNSIVETLREIWHLWSIRGCIILSLSLQIFLFLFASLRRKTSNTVVYFLIWSAYLLADWIPTFTVGLILKSLSTSTTSSSLNWSTGPPGDDDDLLALWAASLLWHLGGSFGITAFALKDNELWYRHSVVTAAQFATAFYIFLRTLPHNKLIIPTVFALLGGFFSNVLRVHSMRLASLDKYREDFVAELDLSLYPECSAEKLHKKDKSEPLCLPEELVFAYDCFKIFKGLVVNIKCWSDEQQQITQFFCSGISPEYAYWLCELSCMYDVFYTNHITLTRRFGICCWLISFISCTVVLGRFVQAEKQDFHHVDVRISNALVIVPLVLCLLKPYFIFLYMLKEILPFRDLSFPAKWARTCRTIYLPFWIQNFCKSIRLRESQIKIKPDITHRIDGTPIFFREWSESICSHNLISHCLKEQSRVIYRPYRLWVVRIRKILHEPFQAIGRVLLFPGKLGTIIFRPVLDRMGLKNILDRAMYVSRDHFDKDLWDFVFNNLQNAVNAPFDTKAGELLSEARGGWALRNCNHSTKLLDYIKDVEYDERLLMWHIATELCYNAEDDGDLSCSVNDGESSNNRVFSKMLSDYMLYLMVFRPRMTSTVSVTFLRRYEPICKRLSELLHRVHRGQELQEACWTILHLPEFFIQPDPETGDSKIDVLSRACTLTEELMQLLEEERWTVLSDVWLEMLVYTARNCRGDIHARLLCRGGEFLTLVWLLMAHFGLI